MERRNGERFTAALEEETIKREIKEEPESASRRWRPSEGGGGRCRQRLYEKGVGRDWQGWDAIGRDGILGLF